MSKRRHYTRSNKPSSAYLDIVIVTGGNQYFLERCIGCIPKAAGDVDYKLIIVDNGVHGDKSGRASWYKKIDPNCEVIFPNKNVGYTGGCQIGGNYGKSPFILLMNDDVFLDENAISNAIVNFEKDKTIGVVGMKLFFPPYLNNHEDKRTIQHVGIMTTLDRELVHCFIGWSEDNPRVLGVREVLCVTGASYMTPRPLWKKVGGIDQQFVMGYYEDTDYCMKVRKEGYNVIVEQQSTGVHLAGRTFRITGTSHVPENKARFMVKWGKVLPWTEWIHW